MRQARDLRPSVGFMIQCPSTLDPLGFSQGTSTRKCRGNRPCRRQQIRDLQPKETMKRKDSFLMQNVGGENLLVPLGSRVVDMNGMVILNETGSLVWTLLEEDRSVEDLATAVAERFDVDFERAFADVRSFLDEIARMGLVE